MITTQDKTELQVYTEVLQAIINQGGQCLFNGQCVYGNGQGHHCAIGWLLPENDTQLMDYGGDLESLVIEDISLGPNDAFIRNNVKTLARFQQIHDVDTGFAFNSACDFILEKFPELDPLILKWKGIIS